MPLVVKSGVREFMGKQGAYKNFRISEKTWAAMESAVEGLVKAGLMRCKANGRKTLQAQDL